jgi:hypothetical protein
MSHFARVIDGVVVEVLVAEQDFIDTYSQTVSGEWIQTSYNTYGGEHPEGMPLRKNFAGVGYTYDAERDAFYEPQPYPSWTLNEDTCLWEAPVAYPTDGNLYTWNEAQLQWEPINND